MKIHSLAAALIASLLASASVFAADAVMEAPPEPPVAEATALGELGIWGAIAYSPSTSSAGIFWGADKRDEADATAMKHCQRKGGDDCQVVITYRQHRHWNDDDGTGFPYNQCAALATDQSGMVYGVGNAKSSKEAKSQALTQCGDASCKIKTEGCT